MFSKHHFLSLALVFALVVGLAFAWASYSGDRSTPRQASQPGGFQLPTVEAATRKLTPLPSRPLSAKTRAMRERAAAAAAKGRGLAWLSEPGMTELTGWEYGTRTREMADVLGGEDLHNLGRLAAAGAVLPEGLDLSTLAAGFTAVSASATYSPFDKQILLISNSKPNESLLTHELTHALQDQHFDLLRLLLARPYDYDRGEAAFAVVEGDAVGVQRRAENPLWQRRSLDDITRAEDSRFDEYRNSIGSLFPSLLTETFIFRYRDGTRFVENVRRKRGQEGVDALFRQPPASSEQVLHAEKYFAGEAPRPVALNEARFEREGWRKTIATGFGEIGVRGVLMERLDATEARRAAGGWGGDRAYLFERGKDQTLFVWQTVWDTPEDAAEFFRGYNRLLERRGLKAEDGGGRERVVWREADGTATVVLRDSSGVLILRGREAAEEFSASVE